MSKFYVFLFRLPFDRILGEIFLQIFSRLTFVYAFVSINFCDALSKTSNMGYIESRVMRKMGERSLYPLVEEELKRMGKVVSTYRRRREEGELIPDFVIESEDGKITAVEVGCEVHRKHLVELLCRRAFKILIHLQRFEKVLYIASYEELKILCDLLHSVNVELGGKLQTMDIGYSVGTDVFDAKLEEMSLELGKVKKALRKLEYRV